MKDTAPGRRKVNCIYGAARNGLHAGQNVLLTSLFERVATGVLNSWRRGQQTKRVDIQRLISATVAEGLEPKTVRNLWGTISLIWDAALAQEYVDAALPKPKLPRRTKKKARFYNLNGVARVIAASQGEQRVFYWLAAETGLRLRLVCGLVSWPD
jgi:integrase